MSTATTTEPGVTTMPLLYAVPLDHPALNNRVRDWADAEQVHKAVMALFQENLPGAQHERRATARILYRLEAEAGRILVQATRPMARTDYGIRATDLTGLIPYLTPGATVHVRVDVNAVRCQNGTGRRIPVPDDDLAEWLAARLAPSLDRLTLLDARTTVSRTGTTPLRIAHITASTRIHDTGALLEQIRTGVGRARAYGCGLLSVLPAA
jgi:CRISPR system Cascade subunit CasE